MKYLNLVIVCIAVYVIGFCFDLLNGRLWFLGKSTLSVCVVLSAFRIGGNISLPIMSIETCFICVTLFSFVSWMTDKQSFLYTHYELLLMITCLLELIVITLGAPWRGIINRVSQHLGADLDRSPTDWVYFRNRDRH